MTSVLVLAPTSLKYQWKCEIVKFTGDTEVVVVEGTHLKRREMYDAPGTYKIVSYNSACNDIKILGKLECDLLIMDEVQRLKNWNTQISKAARRIVSDYSVILSGTPLENKLEELYSIVEFADQYALSPYYKFRNDCILTDDTGKVLGYQNLNAVGNKLKDILIRRRKKDVNLQAASTIINLDLPWNPAVLEQRIARIYRIGQQRNIQVINLVAARTIEESMIGKLKFKTSLFEGVLDGGDDAVFASDDKFAKIMALVGEYVEPSAEEPQPDDSGTTVETSDVEKNTTQSETGASSKGSSTPAVSPVSDASVCDPATEDEDIPMPDEPENLVNQGLSFFSNLVETLASPEKTAKLIDEIAVEDKETGKASINIPVKSKQHITDALALIGKLLAK